MQDAQTTLIAKAVFKILWAADLSEAVFIERIKSACPEAADKLESTLTWLKNEGLILHKKGEEEAGQDSAQKYYGTADRIVFMHIVRSLIEENGAVSAAQIKAAIKEQLGEEIGGTRFFQLSSDLSDSNGIVKEPRGTPPVTFYTMKAPDLRYFRDGLIPNEWLQNIKSAALVILGAKTKPVTREQFVLEAIATVRRVYGGKAMDERVMMTLPLAMEDLRQEGKIIVGMELKWNVLAGRELTEHKSYEISLSGRDSLKFIDPNLGVSPVP